MSAVPASCLGCGKKFNVPGRLAMMAERYEDGRLVLFCDRRCNVEFVRRESEKLRVRKIQEIIDRVKADVDNSDPSSLQRTK